MSKPADFVVTEQAKDALAMCKAVMESRQYERMGQITGDPGTGKTRLTSWLADQLDGIRVECFSGMHDKGLMKAVCRAYNAKGTFMDDSGTASSMLERLLDVVEGQIIFVDEANHLAWRRLEKLRALSDLGGASIILCGTDLLARHLNHYQSRAYTQQLRSRIGTKKIVVQPIKDNKAFGAYVLAPRFPNITQETARRFRVACKGNWRVALGLADACERLMINEGIDRLDADVIATAQQWLAGNDLEEAE